MRRPVDGALVVALLAGGGPALAHRLDETLVATLVSLEPGQLRLTTHVVPGQWVAEAAIARIDTDGDGTFSAAEQRAWVARLLHEQASTLDGRAIAPAPVSWRFPTPAEVRAGQGEIRIESALATSLAAGQHVFTLASRPAADTAYLVNAAAPTAPELQVVAQKRDAGQTNYALDFRTGVIVAPKTTAIAAPTGRAGRIAAALSASLLVLASALLLRQRRSGPGPDMRG